MKHKDLWCANKLLILLGFVFLTITAQAQRRPGIGGYAQEFLKTQWWLGLRTGANVTNPRIVDRYSTLSPINREEEDLEKEYKTFNIVSAQAGLDITFYHRGVAIGLQPTYKRNKYEYSNELAWQGADPNVQYQETSYTAIQQLDLLEIPLSVKYEIIQHGKARPFVMAGGYYSIITSAQKEVDVTETDVIGGTQNETDKGTLILGVKDQFRNFLGVQGGVGISLDYWNIRTVVEATYLRGMTDVTRDSERFTQNELTSIGDVNDEILLDNINLSLSFVFPLRYIDKQFQAY